MSNVQCRVCGAELLPSTAFCRQCGAAVADVVPASEQQTALFGQTAESSTTQRLDPRPTNPDRGGLSAPDRAATGDSSASGPAWPKSLMVLAIIGALAGVLTVVAIVRLRSPSSLVGSTSVSDSRLSYPGAQSIVDMTNNDGSRTLQLQTSDPIDQVQSWYQTNLTLTKTVRLTSASVVMKGDKVTVTLANDDNKTVILIKQSP